MLSCCATAVSTVLNTRQNIRMSILRFTRLYNEIKHVKTWQLYSLCAFSRQF